MTGTKLTSAAAGQATEGLEFPVCSGCYEAYRAELPFLDGCLCTAVLDPHVHDRPAVRVWIGDREEWFPQCAVCGDYCTPAAALLITSYEADFYSDVIYVREAEVREIKS